jgi:putative FmdB family regulatory protein
MPTYEYQCKSCDHTFELFQSMKDSPKRTCPKCGKAALERLIGTGAAVIFKGSGFYQTDYRSDSYKKAAEAESKPSGNAGDKTPETKGDAAPPAAKAEPAPAAAPAAKEAKVVTRVPSKSAAKSTKKTSKRPGKSR